MILNNCLRFLKEPGSQDLMRSGDTVAMQLCELQKVRDEQARCEFVCVCKFLKDRDEQARCRSIYAMSMRWWIISASEVSILKLHIVWAYDASYSHTVSHHTAQIHWAQEAAHRKAAFQYYAFILWAQQGASSHTVFAKADSVTSMQWRIIIFNEISAMKLHIVWAQNTSYSHTVFHHTAHICWAQEAAFIN